MPGHDGCNTAPLCASQKRHFSCHGAPALRQLPQVFHSHGHCLLRAQGSCRRARESQPTFPTFHLSAVPLVPTRQAEMKAETLGGWGGGTQAVAPSAHLRVTIHTFSSARRRDYGSFLGENRERGGIGHESSRNPRWRAKALAFKKNSAYVT